MFLFVINASSLNKSLLVCVVGKKPGERQCMEDEEIKDELCEQEGEKEREGSSRYKAST